MEVEIGLKKESTHAVTRAAWDGQESGRGHILTGLPSVLGGCTAGRRGGGNQVSLYPSRFQAKDPPLKKRINKRKTN